MYNRKRRREKNHTLKLGAGNFPLESAFLHIRSLFLSLSARIHCHKTVCTKHKITLDHVYDFQLAFFSIQFNVDLMLQDSIVDRVKSFICFNSLIQLNFNE